MKNTHAVMQPNKSNECGTGTKHEQGKALQPSIIYYSQALSISLLVGHGATTFIQRKARKNPLKDKGVDGTP